MENFYFHETIVSTLDGRTLKSLKPVNGYYWHPVAVINLATENSTFYDPKDFMWHLTSPQSRFKMTLNRGALYGELDHPTVPNTEEGLKRLMMIDQNNKCHFIKELKTTKLSDADNGWIIHSNLKPVPPKGYILEPALEDPDQNTAFSLRSLIRGKWDPAKKVEYRRIVQLKTFDYVDVPGSNEATKRYAAGIGTEHRDTRIDPKILVESASSYYYEYGKAAGFERGGDDLIAHMLSSMCFDLDTGLFTKRLIRNDHSFMDGTTLDKVSPVHLANIKRQYKQ